jgi:hypothetical protein
VRTFTSLTLTPNQDPLFSIGVYSTWQVGCGCWLLVVGCWLLVVGCWFLVLGSWWIVGCWLLAVGCWCLVLVVGYWLCCRLLVAGLVLGGCDRSCDTPLSRVRDRLYTSKRYTYQYLTLLQLMRGRVLETHSHPLHICTRGPWALNLTWSNALSLSMYTTPFNTSLFCSRGPYIANTNPYLALLHSQYESLPCPSVKPI